MTEAKRKTYYLDSSAYVRILLAEEHGSAIAKEIEGGRVVSNVLLLLESRRTILREARTGRLDPKQAREVLDRIRADREMFDLRETTEDLCDELPIPAISTPRSLDLAHLRTALWFHERSPLARFVSLDDRQNAAAREFGLPT